MSCWILAFSGFLLHHFFIALSIYHVHLVLNGVAKYMVEPLLHIFSLLYIRSRTSFSPVADQCKLLRTAQTAPDCEGSFLRVVACHGVVRDAERAIVTAGALCLDLVLPTVHDIIVAWLAEIVAALGTNEKTDRAAVHTLKVYELVAVFFAHLAAKT